MTAIRVLGLDPGLRHTGWGVIEVGDGNRLRGLASGMLRSDASFPLARRLFQIFDGVEAVIAAWSPDEAACEETFVNKNPASTLKLGQARGAALAAMARAGLPVAEYAPKTIKLSVVGTGGAAKEQVQMMVRTLLPGCAPETADAADALAAAICHAHLRTSAVNPLRIDPLRIEEPRR